MPIPFMRICEICATENGKSAPKYFKYLTKLKAEINPMSVIAYP